MKKNKSVIALYDIGAIKINYNVKGESYPLWLVVSINRKHGGLCYLLVKSKLNTAIEVAQWAFGGYGLRWKIEEYNKHIKQEYKLESIQLKIFDELQSMLAVFTVCNVYNLQKKYNRYILICCSMLDIIISTNILLESLLTSYIIKY